MPTKTVNDYILEVLTPVYGVATEVGPDAGSVQELLKRWWSGEGNSGNPTNQALFDRYTAAGAVGASLQDKALDFWGRGLLKSGVYLPGTAGNYISSPDSTLVSITGDIDIRWYGKATTWRPAANKTFIAKYGTGTPQRSFRCFLNSVGQPCYAWSQDGITPQTITVTWSIPSLTEDLWLRFTHDVDNGAGGNTVKVFSSDDGITWTERHSATNVGIAGVVSVFDSTSPLEIGSFNAGASEIWDGAIYYAEVRDGIDGRIVAKFDSSTIQKTGAALPASINGWTWNGSGLRKIDDYVDLPGTSGNYLSYPDTPAFPTGDIDLRMKLSLDDWTPGVAGSIISKYVNGGQRCFKVIVQTGGQLQMFVSTTGTDQTGGSASGVLGFADGSVNWVRITRVQSTGIVNYYTSSDGVTWASTGTPAALLAGQALLDTTSPLEIMSNNNGTADLLAGNVYYAEVRNGINGPVVAYFDARNVQTPWTMNGSGWSYEASSFVEKPELALSLPGTSGNDVTAPDSAALDITGDIDVRACVKVTTFDGSGEAPLIAKWNSATQKSYLLTLSSDGRIIFRTSTDGAATLTVVNSPIGSAPTGVKKWYRATRIQSTGVNKAYISDDGVTWTEIDSETNNVGTAIFVSTSIIELGRQQTIWPWAGTYYYAEVRNGIDGPIVARFDASAVVKTGTRLPATVTQQPGYPAANLLTPNQASAETDLTGFVANGANTTIAQTGAQFLDGIKSVEATSVAAGSMGIRTATTLVPVVPGKAYTPSAWSRAVAVAASFRAYLNWLTSVDGYISSSTSTPVANTTTGWTGNTGPSAVAVATAAKASLVAGDIIAAGAGEVDYFDRMSVVETPTPWTINGSAWDWVESAA